MLIDLLPRNKKKLFIIWQIINLEKLKKNGTWKLERGSWESVGREKMKTELEKLIKFLCKTVSGLRCRHFFFLLPDCLLLFCLFQIKKKRTKIRFGISVIFGLRKIKWNLISIIKFWLFFKINFFSSELCVFLNLFFQFSCRQLRDVLFIYLNLFAVVFHVTTGVRWTMN